MRDRICSRGDCVRSSKCNSCEVARNPENTVFDAKRLIGRKCADQVVVADCKLWPFKVIPGAGDKPMIQVHYMGEDKKFHPEEISSMILIKMKETAEASGSFFSRIPCSASCSHSSDTLGLWYTEGMDGLKNGVAV